jgi:hypothetical protein
MISGMKNIREEESLASRNQKRKCARISTGILSKGVISRAIPVTNYTWALPRTASLIPQVSEVVTSCFLVPEGLVKPAGETVAPRKILVDIRSRAKQFGQSLSSYILRKPVVYDLKVAAQVPKIPHATLLSW